MLPRAFCSGLCHNRVIGLREQFVLADTKGLIVNNTSKTLSLDNVAIATQIGVTLAELNLVENKAEVLKREINGNIKALHHNKVKVGIYRKDGTGCAVATGFIDGCVAGGIKASTAQRVYLGTFKSAVASGKEVADWNSSREKSKGGASNKATKKAEFADKLAKAYRDEEFAGFIVDLEKAWDDQTIKTLMEGVKSYLEMNGIKTDKK